MEYTFGNDNKLVFSNESLATLNAFRQTEPHQHEAGGILLGRVYAKGNIVIEQVSTPSAEDNSGRYFFNRSVSKAQKIVNEAWKQSDGELQYLGEWHTHPENYPTPSITDKRLIKSMLNDTKQMQIPILFLVIVGIRGYYVGIQHKGKRLTKLTED